MDPQPDGSIDPSFLDALYHALREGSRAHLPNHPDGGLLAFYRVYLSYRELGFYKNPREFFHIYLNPETYSRAPTTGTEKDLRSHMELLLSGATMHPNLMENVTSKEPPKDVAPPSILEDLMQVPSRSLPPGLKGAGVGRTALKGGSEPRTLDAAVLQDMRTPEVPHAASNSVPQEEDSPPSPAQVTLQVIQERLSHLADARVFDLPIPLPKNCAYYVSSHLLDINPATISLEDKTIAVLLQQIIETSILPLMQHFGVHTISYTPHLVDYTSTPPRLVPVDPSDKAGMDAWWAMQTSQKRTSLPRELLKPSILSEN